MNDIPVFGQLLSCACTASILSVETPPRLVGWVWERDLEGTKGMGMSLAMWCWGQKEDTREGWREGFLIRWLSSEATSTCTGALLPRPDISWMEIENAPCCFVCFHGHPLLFLIILPSLGSMCFSSYFLPHVLLRRGSSKLSWWTPGNLPRWTHYSPFLVLNVKQFWICKYNS